MWPLDDDDDEQALRKQKWWMKLIFVVWSIVIAGWLTLVAIAYIFKVNFVADEHFIHWPVDRNQLRAMCDLDDEQFSDFPPKRKIVESNKLLISKFDEYLADELKYQQIDWLSTRNTLASVISAKKAFKLTLDFDETNRAIDVVKRVRARLAEFSKEVEGKK